MCNRSNEFSFVYSYVTDPRFIEMQRAKDEAMSHCKDNMEILSKEMTELKTVLASVTMKYKVAEDARKVMIKRNSILLDDNQFLQQRLRETEELRLNAEKSVSNQAETIKRMETALKEILSEGVPEHKKKKRALLLRERTTSTSDLLNHQVINEEVEVADEETDKPFDDKLTGQEEDEDVFRRVKDSTGDAGSGEPKLPQKQCPSELAPMRALQRTCQNKLVKLSQELERQKIINSRKSSELTVKWTELQLKSEELEEAKKLILSLKKKLRQNSLSKKKSVS